MFMITSSVSPLSWWVWPQILIRAVRSIYVHKVSIVISKYNIELDENELVMKIFHLFIINVPVISLILTEFLKLNKY